MLALCLACMPADLPSSQDWFLTNVIRSTWLWGPENVMGGKDIWHYIDHNTQQVLPGLWKYGDHILNTFQSLGKGPWLFTFLSLTLESRLCVFLCVCLYEYFEYHSICMCVYLLVCIVCLCVCMYLCMWVSMCLCVRALMWVYVCLCPYMCLCMCEYM